LTLLVLTAVGMGC